MKITFHQQFLSKQNLITFCITQASKLYVSSLNLALVLLFISLNNFFECIFGENVTDFEIFKTVVAISIYYPFHHSEHCSCPMPPKQLLSMQREKKLSFKVFPCVKPPPPQPPPKRGTVLDLDNIEAPLFIHAKST